MRKVVAFCPWVKFRAKPFSIAGVKVTGFHEIEHDLTSSDREALWRAPIPYYDHFLRDSELQSWNDNPLLYVIDETNPLKEPTNEEISRINLVNAFLYLCTFALNEMGPGGLAVYTNGADWALYFHPVDDPEFFALGERRLYGMVHNGGHQWKGSAFTLPVECNRFELIKSDGSLVAAITGLYNLGHAQGYLYPVRTFVLGTSDNHLWQREHDLPLIWGAIEQLMQCEPFTACSAAQNEIGLASKVLSLRPNHSLCFVRAVVNAPQPEHVWNQDFRQGKSNEVNVARNSGVEFSALERALDELNWARNRVVHDGSVIPTSEWNLLSLAYLGTRFFVAAFKRILAWEGVRGWTDKDDCEVLGLQALAKESRTSLSEGYEAYKKALDECLMQKTVAQAVESLNFETD